MKNKSFWLKQAIACLIILIMALSSAEEAQASSRDRYKNIAGEAKFTEIQKQIAYSASSISDYKALDAYREINNALNEFSKLRQTVERVDRIDDVIDEVADGLDRIANAYDKVASFGENMSQFSTKEFSYLKNIDRETFRTQEEIKKRIASLNSDNKYFQKKVGTTKDEIELQEFTIKIKGNESIINSLEGQRIIWDKFYLAQNKLLESLEFNGRKINFLLEALKVNASVYHEAATVAHLRRSAKGALEDLGALADIKDIMGDLQDSWLQVSDLVSEISNAEFTLDI